MVFNTHTLSKDVEKFFMERGDFFIYNQLIEGVGDGSTLDFLIRNTASGGEADSEKSFIVIESLVVSSEGKTVVENIKNVSIDSAGSVKDLNNAHTGFTNDSIAEIQEAPSFSGGDSLGKQLLGSASGPSRVGGKDGGVPSFILHPGGNLAGRITNESGQVEDLSIRVVWYEVPKSLLEEGQP